MKAIGLRCVNCHREYSLGLLSQCPDCFFPLEVCYEALSGNRMIETAGKQGIWRYGPLLPTLLEKEEVSLGEGNTPLLHAQRLNERMGLQNLYIKYEGQNPTGSFKDRPTAVGVSMALSLGLKTVTASSTGNAGASLAAYAARAGLHALIFVTDRTPPAKLVQMVLYGARVITVQGSLSDAYWLARNASVEWGWMNLTSTFLSPYGVEGDKTVAYELYQQLDRTPDWIIVPVSVGPLLVGIYNGYLDLKKLGLIERLPRMVAAQSSACAPIARAFKHGDDYVRSWERLTDTVAGGIADPLIGYEQDGTYTLRVIRNSNGAATVSTDVKILEATQTLARDEGIFSEPTGAVSLAALNELRDNPFFDPEQMVVCLVTGHGLKQVRAFEKQIQLPEAIEPTLEALSVFLKKQFLDQEEL